MTTKLNNNEAEEIAKRIVTRMFRNVEGNEGDTLALFAGQKVQRRSLSLGEWSRSMLVRLIKAELNKEQSR